MAFNHDVKEQRRRQRLPTQAVAASAPARQAQAAPEAPRAAVSFDSHHSSTSSAREDRRRMVSPERLGSLEIDGQMIAIRLLYRQVARLRPRIRPA
jgi:hypothetical protein